jgi:hypothetical protein
MQMEKRPVLIMFTEDGSFFPFEVARGIPLEQEAAKFVELNAEHVVRIEDAGGRILWSRPRVLQ